jgi:hypothetical protein
LPTVGGAAELYPLATTRITVLQDIGFTGGYQRTLPFESASPEGDPIPTTFSRILAGVRARIRIAPAEIGVSAAFGWQEAVFEAEGRIREQVPTVAYRYVRPGLDARLRLTRIAFELAGAYELVLDSGELGERFTGTTIHGIDALAAVSLRVTDWFEARLSGEYSRRFFSFSSAAGDAYAASGAYDQAFALSFGPAVEY